eukprot:161143_1
MLEGMINHEINAKKCIAPDYIQDTFKALVTHKKQIVINLSSQDKASELFDFILHQSKRTYCTTMNEQPKSISEFEVSSIIDYLDEQPKSISEFTQFEIPKQIPKSISEF